MQSPLSLLFPHIYVKKTEKKALKKNVIHKCASQARAWQNNEDSNEKTIHLENNGEYLDDFLHKEQRVWISFSKIGTYF